MAPNSDMGNAPLITPLRASETPSNYFTMPGLHGHNGSRRAPRSSSSSSALQQLRIAFLVFGFFATGYYGYTLTNQYIYQAYQNWAFDQQIAGRAHARFADYLREQTPFAFLVGGKTNITAMPATNRQSGSITPKELPHLASGALVGRVAISRLNITAMVREGVDLDTLSKAVGHVPTTALPGQPGNFAIAAHRDTLFRALKDIQKDDLVTFQSEAGTYTYQILATKIVQPSDVSVLQPNGGGLIPPMSLKPNQREGESLLTMITCYPFNYLGSAPKRFIVEGKLVSTEAKPLLPLADSRTDASNIPPPERAPKRVTHPPARARVVNPANLREPRHKGGPSRFRKPIGSSQAATVNGTQHSKHSNKHGFWHKLFGGN